MFKNFFKNLFTKKRAIAMLITVGAGAVGYTLPPEVTTGIVEVIGAGFE